MEYKEIKFLSKGALVSLLGKIITAFLSYLYLFILTRFLGPYWLGIYGLGITITFGIAILSQAGFPFSLLHFIPIYKSTKDYSRLKGIFWFSLGVTLLLSCLFSLSLLFAAKFIVQFLIKDVNFLRPLQFFSLAVPLLSVHAVIGSILRGTKDIKTMVFIHCIPAFLSIVLFFVLVHYFAMNIFAAIIAYNSAYFIAVAFGFRVLLFRLSSILNKAITAMIDIRKVLFYSLPLLFFESIRSLFARTDILMLGYFLSARIVGLYSPALRLSLLVSFALHMLNQPFAPLISEYYHHKKTKALSDLYQTATRWIFIFGFPCFLFLVLFGREMLRLFGEQFTEAYFTLVILSLGQLINAGVGSVGLLLIMTGHQRFILVGTVCANIVNVVCNFILIPRFSIIGAAIATAATIIALNVINLCYVKKVINIQPYNIKFYKPLVGGIISFFFILLIKRSLVFADYKLELIILGGAFFIVFTLIFLMLKPDSQEKYVFVLMKRRLFSK